MSGTSELSILKNIAYEIGKNHHKLPNKDLTGFMAMVGQKYDRDLMVIGRAVNGWSQGWKPDSFCDWNKIDLFADGVLESVEEGKPCPMSWVTNCWGNMDFDYNTAKSAFWRVIRNVTLELNPYDDAINWPSYLVWSNLYKISPAEGGNPSDRLCAVQFELCKFLLLEEIKTYKPRHLLFLTGGWANPFLDVLNPAFEDVTDCTYVEAVGKTSVYECFNSKFVVAAHPQGKVENKWVEEVIEAFNQ